jgi:hypothetical protein
MLVWHVPALTTNHHQRQQTTPKPKQHSALRASKAAFAGIDTQVQVRTPPPPLMFVGFFFKKRAA